MAGNGDSKSRLRWAIVVFLVLGSALGGGWYLHRKGECSDRCVAVHEALLRAARSGNHAAAYGLMSAEYRSNNTLARFEGMARMLAETPDYDWRVVQFGLTRCRIGRQSGFFAAGAVYEYVREDGQWRFTGQTALVSD